MPSESQQRGFSRQRLDAAKARIVASGKTITSWAAERGFKRKHVYNVLRGDSLAHFGEGHRIAVALGLKAEPAPAPPVAAQPARAAAPEQLEPVR